MERQDLEELSRMARDGDIEARNRIVESYAHLAKATAAKMSRGLWWKGHIAECDVHLACLAGLISAAAKWNPDGGASFETYAITSMRRAAADEMKERSVRAASLEALSKTKYSWEDMFPSDRPGIQDEAIRTEECDRLTEAFNALGDVDRELMIRKYDLRETGRSHTIGMLSKWIGGTTEYTERTCGEIEGRLRAAVG